MKVPSSLRRRGAAFFALLLLLGTTGCWSLERRVFYRMQLPGDPGPPRSTDIMEVEEYHAARAARQASP